MVGENDRPATGQESLASQRQLFDEFYSLYQKVSNLPKEDFDNLLWHDLRGLVSNASAFFSMLTDEDVGGVETPFLADFRRAAKRIQDNDVGEVERLGLFKRIVSITINLITQLRQEGSSEIETLKPVISRIEALQKLMPIFLDSFFFLRSPSPQLLERLSQKSTDLATVIDVVSSSQIQPAGDVKTKINGLEAIMLFNILKNAVRHGTGQVDVVVTEYSIEVSNPAKKLLNEEIIFQPGVKGAETGNTGMGLTIVKMYSILDGNTLSFSQSKNPDGSVRVSFGIKRR